MRRRLVIAAFLGLGALGISLAYQVVARDHRYQTELVRGEAALKNKDLFGAIQAYSTAISLRPDSIVAHLRRGEAHRARRDLDAAARDFRQAATLDPSAPRPIEALGDALYDRGWFEHAAAAYETRLRLDDSAPAVAHKLALAWYRHGNVDGALAALELSLRLGHSAVDTQYLRGLCLREKGQLAEAVEAFETAIAAAPGLIPAREELADLYGALGRRREELEQLEALAALDRANVERQVAVGLAHARAARATTSLVSQQRNADLAVLTLGQALERAPDQPLIYGSLGQVWLEIALARDDRVALSKAIEALERAASMAAVTSDILTQYGRALLEDRQVDAAERVLLQATRRYPVDPAAFLVYAAVAERRQHHEAARTALITYGAVVPEEPDFAGRAAAIARLSLRLKEPVVAANWLERACRARPADINLLAALADAQMRAGDIARARQSIELGLQRAPDNAQLLVLARRASLL
jgi:tetratricopeptide (TPR) repeat protein